MAESNARELLGVPDLLTKRDLIDEIARTLEIPQKEVAFIVESSSTPLSVHSRAGIRWRFAGSGVSGRGKGGHVSGVIRKAALASRYARRESRSSNGAKSFAHGWTRSERLRIRTDGRRATATGSTCEILAVKKAGVFVQHLPRNEVADFFHGLRFIARGSTLGEIADQV